VITSLSATVRRLMVAEGAERVAWFGYSGGGTLAVLLASHFPETVSVVTIAANLDTAAWAAYMEGHDLSGSLNPASYPPLSQQIQQRHYAGGKDRVVPPALTAQAAAHLGATLIVLDAYDHVRCWERLWPTILNELAAEATPLHANKPMRSGPPQGWRKRADRAPAALPIDRHTDDAAVGPEIPVALHGRKVDERAQTVRHQR
jgi:pimeloyl-ACP methyl ester carboxylesterase